LARLLFWRRKPPPLRQVLEEASTEEEIAVRDLLSAFLGLCDTEEIAPSKGLAITEHTVVSERNANTVNIRFIRPDGHGALPCVYYSHGGGLQTMSCYDGNYRAWGRIIAAQELAVAMVDFRNALMPSSVDEVAPFPAGLNDCVSGVKWVAANHAELAIDPDRVVVAGESGRGNLTLATGLRLKQDGDLGLIKVCTRCAPTSPASGRCLRTRRRSRTTAPSSACTTTAAP
jgi:acetyl esterase